MPTNKNDFRHAWKNFPAISNPKCVEKRANKVVWKRQLSAYASTCGRRAPGKNLDLFWLKGAADTDATAEKLLLIPTALDPPQMASHPSTNQAHNCLTSVIVGMGIMLSILCHVLFATYKKLVTTRLDFPILDCVQKGYKHTFLKNPPS